jgi:anti-sigma B factor antagonist
MMAARGTSHSSAARWNQARERGGSIVERARVVSGMSEIEVFEGDRPKRCPVCGSPAIDRRDGPGESPCPACGHLLWFASRTIGNVTVIKLLDTRVAVMELLELLDNAIAEGTLERIVLNFGGIQQVSSAALGKLVKLSGEAGSVRGRLRLCGLHPDLRQVCRITRLDCVFDIHETEAEALTAFAAETQTRV